MKKHAKDPTEENGRKAKDRQDESNKITQDGQAKGKHRKDGAKDTLPQREVRNQGGKRRRRQKTPETETRMKIRKQPTRPDKTTGVDYGGAKRSRRDSSIK